MDQTINTSTVSTPRLRTRRNLWGRIDRYIFSEIHFPFWNAMLFYNGIFFIRIFGEVSELSGGKVDVPFKLFFLYFASQLPETLFLTITLSFFFATLAAMGRVSADSEVVACQAAGISFWRFTRPVLAYGFTLSVLLFLLVNLGGPALNQYWLARYQSFIENDAIPNIDPGVINPITSNAVLYVDRVDSDMLAGVMFINQSADGDDILLADRAVLYSNRDMQLYSALNVQLPADPTQPLNAVKARELERSIPIPKGLSSGEGGRPKDLLRTDILYRELVRGHWQNNELAVELYRRLFEPFLCFVLAFFSVPIAARFTRFKKGSGFGLSLIILAAYFLLAKMGRDAAVVGKVSPFVGVAAPVGLFLLMGLLLQLGKSRGWGHLMARLQDRVVIAGLWIVRQLGKPLAKWRKNRREPRTAASRGRRPAHTFSFPSRLDIYIMRSFLSIYFLVQTSLVLIFLLVEYTGITKSVVRNDIGSDVVIRFLLARIPEILSLSMFICLLIATLILLAVMSKNQEIVAVRAAGGSMQRMCLPLLVCGLLATLFSFYMGNTFLPATNRMAVNLKNRIQDRGGAAFAQDVWFRLPTGEIMNYQFFDQRSQRLREVRIYQQPDGEGLLFARTRIPSLIFEDGWRVEDTAKQWRVESALDDRLRMVPQTINAGTRLDLPVAAADLSQRKRRASEFSTDELKDYLKYLQNLGYSETHYQTELYGKYAQPLLPLIMMILAMPLGIHVGRRGAFFGVAIGLGVGLLFWGLFELCKQLGSAGLIHPLAAGWSMVVLFSCIALYRFLLLD